MKSETCTSMTDRLKAELRTEKASIFFSGNRLSDVDLICGLCLRRI
ncbi:Uncharacterized protein dnm_020670 [Desulfonema magnum]|uniref:GST C-terminal domain-containing protein n=1 Tax=Desulfonema magnum TaxID=45655 RepID=A0A975BJ38_9BACT|nr:Uncharacterized protein dnm_020670 [Desulfonema magnum]